MTRQRMFSHPPSQGTPGLPGGECEADALRSLGEGGQGASADSADKKGTAGMPAGLHKIVQRTLFLFFLFIFLSSSSFLRLVTCLGQGTSASTEGEVPSVREQEAYTPEQMNRLTRTAWAKAQEAYAQKDYDGTLWQLEQIRFFRPDDPVILREIERVKKEKENPSGIESTSLALPQKAETDEEARRQREQEDRINALFAEAQGALQSNDMNRLEAAYEELAPLATFDPRLGELQVKVEQHRSNETFQREKQNILDGLLNEGNRFLEQDQFTQAAERYRKALQLDPFCFRAVEKMELAERRLKEQEEQARRIAQTLKETPQEEVQPPVEAPKEEMASPVSEVKPEARPQVEESVAEAPKAVSPVPPAQEVPPAVLVQEQSKAAVQLLIEEGKKLCDQEQYESAIRTFERVFALDAGNKEASRRIDKAKEKLIQQKEKEYKGIKTEVDREVKEHIEATLDHAKSLIEQGRLHEARIELERIEVVEPQNKQAHMLLQYVKDKEKAQARSEEEQIKEDFIRRATVEYLKGNLVEAQSLMEEVLKIDPSDEKAKNSIELIQLKLKTAKPQVAPAPAPAAPAPVVEEKKEVQPLAIQPTPPSPVVTPKVETLSQPSEAAQDMAADYEAYLTEQSRLEQARLEKEQELQRQQLEEQKRLEEEKAKLEEQHWLEQERLEKEHLEEQARLEEAQELQRQQQLQEEKRLQEESAKLEEQRRQEQERLEKKHLEEQAQAAAVAAQAEAATTENIPPQEIPPAGPVSTREQETAQDFLAEYGAFLKEQNRAQEERQAKQRAEEEKRAARLQKIVQEAQRERVQKPVSQAVLSKEDLIELAKEYFKIGELEKSRVAFEEVLKQDPTDRKAIKSIEIINEKLVSQR